MCVVCFGCWCLLLYFGLLIVVYLVVVFVDVVLVGGVEVCKEEVVVV